MLRFRQRRQLTNMVESQLSTIAVTSSERNALSILQRRPLVNFFVIRQVEKELEEAGLLNNPNNIDWDAIGDFILKIAPLIFELIELFM